MDSIVDSGIKKDGRMKSTLMKGIVPLSVVRICPDCIHTYIHVLRLLRLVIYAYQNRGSPVLTFIVTQ